MINDRLQGILFDQTTVVNLVRPIDLPKGPVFMQNDRLQGILFDQTTVVNLVRSSNKKRLRDLFKANKNRRLIPQLTPRKLLTVKPSPFALKIDERNRQEILDELLSRLRTRS